MARHASTSVAVGVAKDLERGKTKTVPNFPEKKRVFVCDYIVCNVGKVRAYIFRD